jgi:hypothetical protein
LPTRLPDQLIDAIGQRVEIKVTSARQSLRALPKRARDIGNGLQKVGESPNARACRSPASLRRHF